MKVFIQPLLFWQVLAASWLAGALAWWEWPALAVLPVLALADRRCWDWRRLAALLLCAVLGFGYAGWRAEPEKSRELEEIGESEARDEKVLKGRVEGEVVGVRGLFDRRVQVILDTVTVSGEALSGKLVWSQEGTDNRPIPGQKVRFTATVKAAGGFRNQGSDNSLYWSRQGVYWRSWTDADTPVDVEGAGHTFARWREALRRGLVDQLAELYPEAPWKASYGRATPSAPHGWGFVPALLFGDRFYLGADDMHRLQDAGLAHSIALSGQHLAVVGLAAAGLMWILGLGAPGVFLRMPRFALGLCASLPFAAVYLWIGDAPASLLRAAVMLLFWAALCVGRRPAAFTDAIFAALVCLTLLDPAGLKDVGVQLSFSAVAGLALAEPLFRDWVNWAGQRRVLSAFGCVLISSVVVQIATLPVTLAVFGRVTPWFWLNLLWLPVLGAWVLPLSALGLLLFGAGIPADWILRAAVEPCHWLVLGLEWLNARFGLDAVWCLRPHWTAMIGFGAVLVAAAWTLGRGNLSSAAKRLTVVGMGLLLLAPGIRALEGVEGLVRERVNLRLLDVGQGQAALLELPAEQRVLVDGGGFRSARFDSGRDLIAPLLTANRPPRLAAVVMSHADMDHARGLLFFARHFAVGELWIPAEGSGHENAEPLLRELLTVAAEKHIPVRRLMSGDVRAFGGVRFETLAPVPGMRQTDNDGLVLRLARQINRDGLGVDMQDASEQGAEKYSGLVILPGDATKSLLAALERRSREGAGQPGNLRAEVLVAPHHGSRHNVRPGFVRAVNPTVVLASCGAQNRYGFPSEELRELCAELDVPLRSTADEGEIRFTWP